MIYRLHSISSPHISYIFYTSLCIHLFSSLLLLLLRSGADPNLPAEPSHSPHPHHPTPPGGGSQFLFYEADQKYPLTLLLRLHVYHHDDLTGLGSSSSTDVVAMDTYLSTMEILCQCMKPSTLQRVFYQYCDHGFYGLFCESRCPVFQVLYKNSSCTRSLRHLCRLEVWKASRERLNRRVGELPLPRELRDYVMWRL